MKTGDIAWYCETLPNSYKEDPRLDEVRIAHITNKYVWVDEPYSDDEIQYPDSGYPDSGYLHSDRFSINHPRYKILSTKADAITCLREYAMDLLLAIGMKPATPAMVRKYKKVLLFLTKVMDL